MENAGLNYFQLVLANNRKPNLARLLEYLVLNNVTILEEIREHHQSPTKDKVIELIENLIEKFARSNSFSLFVKEVETFNLGNLTEERVFDERIFLDEHDSLPFDTGYKGAIIDNSESGITSSEKLLPPSKRSFSERVENTTENNEKESPETLAAPHHGLLLESVFNVEKADHFEKGKRQKPSPTLSSGTLSYTQRNAMDEKITGDHYLDAYYRLRDLKRRLLMNSSQVNNEFHDVLTAINEIVNSVRVTDDGRFVKGLMESELVKMLINSDCETAFLVNCSTSERHLASSLFDLPISTSSGSISLLNTDPDDLAQLCSASLQIPLSGNLAETIKPEFLSTGLHQPSAVASLPPISLPLFDITPLNLSALLPSSETPPGIVDVSSQREFDFFHLSQIESTPMELNTVANLKAGNSNAFTHPQSSSQLTTLNLQTSASTGEEQLERYQFRLFQFVSLQADSDSFQSQSSLMSTASAIDESTRKSLLDFTAPPAASSHQIYSFLSSNLDEPLQINFAQHGSTEFESNQRAVMEELYEVDTQIEVPSTVVKSVEIYQNVIAPTADSPDSNVSIATDEYLETVSPFPSVNSDESEESSDGYSSDTDSDSDFELDDSYY
ncbi:hypothetical protein HK098_001224 [Nowakowskiella sp. JEL0407]|nr:hypothetical protein HK098_001224 [Nowakowskiella sp. JEL0407]